MNHVDAVFSGGCNRYIYRGWGTRVDHTFVCAGYARKMEEDVRFELTTPCGALVFETSAFNRSANLPKI